jgi:hypothetical protein
MTEWEGVGPLEYLKVMLSAEVDPRALIEEGAKGGGTVVLTDDRPVNEFFFLRRYIAGGR